MRRIGRIHWYGVLIVSVLRLAPAPAGAQASPDEPAAVLVYPYVVVDPASGTDTLIQLTNTADELVELRCFYEDFTPECSTGETGGSCLPGAVTCTGICVPHQGRIPLRVRATAGQPLAWQASSGLQTLPLGESNQFSNVPGVGMRQFVGTLRCVAVAADPYRPLLDNILVGQATIERGQSTPVAFADAAQYRAIGVKALPAGADRDEFLNLGGADAEYEACPAIGVLDHFFDGAPLHTGELTAEVSTTLALANCSVSLPAPADNIVQFLVYNEFAQRFTTSRAVHGQSVLPLSGIDGVDSTRSIFWYQVSGTLTGRTLMRGNNGGLHVVAIEAHRDQSLPNTVHSAAINAHGVGARPEGDVLTFRPPRCIGDCNFDGGVTVDEAIVGVNLALGNLAVDVCAPVDADGNLIVTIDELISAVNAALNGCPAPIAPPTPAVIPVPTPTVSVATGAGPEITHLGVATADDRPLQPDSVDVMGRPVYVRPFGQGMTLIIEARHGQSGNAPGRNTYLPTGGLPDLQVLVSRPLGSGDPAVCERNGRSGGVPAVPALDFNSGPATVDAINDLGCRAFGGGTPEEACTRKMLPLTPVPPFGHVSDASEAQFCIPIAKAWAFPVGDTVIAARVRDTAGNLGPVREMVVRVLE